MEPIHQTTKDEPLYGNGSNENRTKKSPTTTTTAAMMPTSQAKQQSQPFPFVYNEVVLEWLEDLAANTVTATAATTTETNVYDDETKEEEDGDNNANNFNEEDHAIYGTSRGLAVVEKEDVVEENGEEKDCLTTVIDDILTCPISQELVQDPVLLITPTMEVSPQLYDKQSIYQWLLQKPTLEPVTGKLYHKLIDGPLYYMDSIHHRKLLIAKYGTDSYQKYDDLDFCKHYKTAWEEKIQDERGSAISTPLTKEEQETMVDKAISNCVVSRCLSVEATLEGLNQRTIDNKKALQLAKVHTDHVAPAIANHPLLIAYHAMILSTYTSKKKKNRDSGGMDKPTREREEPLWDKAINLGLEQLAMTTTTTTTTTASMLTTNTNDTGRLVSTLAQHLLGFYYNYYNASTDMAIMYYKLASENGHPSSQFHLGRILVLRHGKKKRQNKEEEGIYWHQLAAVNGHAGAQLYLGLWYNDLATETAHNKYKEEHYFQMAVYWWMKAAQQGDKTSQNNLGVMYEIGYGVSQQDLQQAMYWYEKAAQQGHEEAKENLQHLQQTTK